VPDLIWDDDLRAFFHDPQGKVKGNRSPYAGMSDVRNVDAVVAYLKR
jgi:cytochrome c